MKILVCGSRHFEDKEFLNRTLTEIHERTPITELIHGAARGADSLAGAFAKRNGIPVSEFPADWKTHGRRAGPIRNSQMLREGNPELVVAYLYQDSRGTKNMIEQAEKAGVPTTVFRMPLEASRKPAGEF